MARRADSKREAVAVPFFAGYRSFIDELVDQGVRYVVMDAPIELPGYSMVLCDHRKGASKLASLLLNAGHRPEDVAVIVGESSEKDSHQWDKAKTLGFLDALERDAEHPLVTTVKAAGRAEDWIDQGAGAARTQLDRFPHITAFALDNSFRALGAVREISRRGLRLPRDVSVVSINRLESWEDYPVEPTYAWAPKRRLGEAAARALYDSLVGGSQAPGSREVDMVIENGASVAPPRRA
jgi:DNA-binding LacI/PurR family transcriptional regulator